LTKGTTRKPQQERQELEIQTWQIIQTEQSIQTFIVFVAFLGLSTTSTEDGGGFLMRKAITDGDLRTVLT
jgi:hypothetical protein